MGGDFDHGRSAMCALNWEEHKGWSYALLGLSPDDVLLSSVLTVIETSYADPEAIADVAQQLVMRRGCPRPATEPSGWARSERLPPHRPRP